MGVVRLKQPNFPRKFYQVLVDSVVSANERYLDDYNMYRKNLMNSDGFWNMRRCFIEQSIFENFSEIKCDYRCYGGPGHLFYTFDDAGVSKSFVVQNGGTFDSSYPAYSKRGDELKERKYMVEYIGKNIGNEFLKQKQITQGEWDFSNSDVNFDSNAVDERINDTEEFYIITFLVDSSTKHIKGVHVWMPSPYDEKAHIIKDLSGLISSPSNYNYDIMTYRGKETLSHNNTPYYKVESFDMSEGGNEDIEAEK
ncbi:Uncharacterised protein [Staphylococcus aureus]|nr:Uncharacterised protein [Staphylococcus aureus]SCU07700.1 Uncharacterised protein [Staphylococcus aureus]